MTVLDCNDLHGPQGLGITTLTSPQLYLDPLLKTPPFIATAPSWTPNLACLWDASFVSLFNSIVTPFYKAFRLQELMLHPGAEY